MTTPRNVVIGIEVSSIQIGTEVEEVEIGPIGKMSVPADMKVMVLNIPIMMKMENGNL